MAYMLWKEVYVLQHFMDSRIDRVFNTTTIIKFG